MKVLFVFSTELSLIVAKKAANRRGDRTVNKEIRNKRHTYYFFQAFLYL